MAIHRTMCSSTKLLKYWLRKRRLGPIKAVSGRCSSLFVMCAIYTRHTQNTASALNTTCTVSRDRSQSVQTYHQLVGDLGDDHAEGEKVQAGVMLEEVARRLLENDEGQHEDEADVQTRSQHTGVLNRGSFMTRVSQSINYVCIYGCCVYMGVDLRPRWSRFCPHLHLK